MRTKSFKYCSKHRKSGCRKASNKYSYRAIQKSDFKRRNKHDSKKSSRSKSKKKEIDYQKSIFKHNIDYKMMGFYYPITKKGIEQGMFVVIPEKRGYSLYLRYSELLIKSMKSKYARMLTLLWSEKGEKAQKKYSTILKNKYKNTQFDKYVDAMSHRIGDPLKIVYDDTLSELSTIWKSMKLSTQSLRIQSVYSDDSDTDEYSDDSDTNDSDDDPKAIRPKPYVAAKAAAKSAFMKTLPL